MNTSRIVTYPSTVESAGNHKVILIDPSENDQARIEFFLKVSEQNFDVYVYRGEYYDLEFLNHICTDADWVLINDSSQVKTNLNNQTRYGTGQELLHPVDYFIKIDRNNVDNATESVV
jgi:hypothetical protein